MTLLTVFVGIAILLSVVAISISIWAFVNSDSSSGDAKQETPNKSINASSRYVSSNSVRIATGIDIVRNKVDTLYGLVLNEGDLILVLKDNVQGVYKYHSESTPLELLDYIVENGSTFNVSEGPYEGVSFMIVHNNKSNQISRFGKHENQKLLPVHTHDDEEWMNVLSAELPNNSMLRKCLDFLRVNRSFTSEGTTNRFGMVPVPPEGIVGMWYLNSEGNWSQISSSEIKSTSTSLISSNTVQGAIDEIDELLCVYGGSNRWVYQHTEDIGSNGGTFTKGEWVTRKLNNTLLESGDDITLENNQITISKSGVYSYDVRAVACSVNGNQARFQNITDSKTVSYSLVSSAPSGSSSSVSTSSLINVGNIPVVLEIQHQCQLTKEFEGFGRAGGMGTEVYCEVLIVKLK